MSSSMPSRSSSCETGKRGKNGTAKGKKLLLAAVCVSLTPSTTAFTMFGPVRQPVHVVSEASSSSTSSSSSALPSSPNDDVHFFTAAPQPSNDEDEKPISKTKPETSSGMVSTERTELESMDDSITTDEEETSSAPQNQSSSSSAPPSSPNDDIHFFTAVSQPPDNEGDEKPNTKTISQTSSGMVSAEQAELESMEISNTTEEQEDLLSTTSVAGAAAASYFAAATPTTAVFMDVDGNGTGALMKRSVTAGGAEAPLMATNPSLAFPIDSGKEGIEAETTRARTQKSLNDGIIDRAQPNTRLVRHSLPPAESSKQGPNQKRLVLASTATSRTGSIKLARPQSPKPHPRLYPPKPKLVRYNGPDVEDSTDYEGMELPSVKKNRDRQLKLQRANLVRYRGASQQKRLTEEVANNNSDTDGSGTEEDHQRNRKNLVEDPGYANRYTGLSDFNLARKTGLAVNKPISLWVERDKFL